MGANVGANVVGEDVGANVVVGEDVVGEDVGANVEVAHDNEIRPHPHGACTSKSSGGQKNLEPNCSWHVLTQIRRDHTAKKDEILAKYQQLN